MSKGQRNRVLRKVANDIATEPNVITNDNIQVKQLTTNNYVQNDKGGMVREVVPSTTYTSRYKDGSPRALYQQLKGDINI